MRTLFLLSLVFSVSIVFADEGDEHVLVLTQDNFDSTISDNEMVLVKFYAPWCGHCKSLAPEYAKAAKQLNEEGSKIRLGKVDATVQTELASKYKVQGYPTLKFFRNGVDMEYNGPRQADGIISWLNKKLGPSIVSVSSSDEVEKLKKDNELVAIMHSTNDDSSEYKVFEETANVIDTIAFAVVKDANLAKEVGIKTPNKLILLKRFDDPIVEYTGKNQKDDIVSFIKLEKVPLVTEFTQESAQVVFESEIKMHILAFSAKKGPDYEDHISKLKEVAKSLKGKCHVVIINMDDADSSRVGEYFGIKADDVPTFRVLSMKDDMQKFQPEKNEFTVEYLKSFTNDVLDGKIKRHLKSADEPADWDKEPVKVLVAKTFNERAVQKDKAVFVEFYAPWCGHCKALAPVWEELGKHFESNKDVIIAKCDATENEFEDIQISSFPTLKFSPKGSTEFVDYKGDRKIENFISFIDSNGKEEPPKESSEKHDEL